VFKILVHVVRHYWRTHQRKPGDQAAEDPAEIQTLASDHENSPSAMLERVEALRVLDGLLARLDEDKREVFVLAEIEQMSAAEIAEIVEANVNTVSSRLRAPGKNSRRLCCAIGRRNFGGSHERPRT